jgi:hypothetical protein
MNPDTNLLDSEAFKASLRSTFEPLGLRPIDRLLEPGPRPTNPRRGVLRPPVESLELLSLTRDPAGVLRWESGPSAFGAGVAGRRAGRGALPPGRVLQQFAYEQLAPNDVNTRLNQLDDWLTPSRGLRRWNQAAQKLEPVPDPSQFGGQRVLLFIHGTFSNCDNTIEQIRKAPGQAGDNLLGRAAAKYAHVLTFDHPTVGVSPAMNAFDLAALLRPLPGELHIVCHSRGGLVTRWFLEGFATDDLRRSARAVMVATSIAGTSLAAPAHIRTAMDYLANVGDVLGRLLKLGSAHPFMAAAGVVMQVLTSAVRLSAKLPLFDAAVALVPGLQGQAKIGNNPELLRLRANTGDAIASSGIQYNAVRADFRPADPGWNFLQYFSKPMQRLAYWGADLVFDGPNDLVVDTASMDDLADGVKIKEVLDYGVNSTVHHTNYFEQERTLKFIGDRLGF